MPEDRRVEQFKSMVGTMRTEALAALDAWLACSRLEIGGTLILQAPYRKARQVPEASFRSEHWPDIS